MTDVGSSLIYWNEKEILPRGIFLSSSGSGGDRLLFWQSFHANDNNKYNPKKGYCTRNDDCSLAVDTVNNQESTLSKYCKFCLNTIVALFVYTFRICRISMSLFIDWLLCWVPWIEYLAVSAQYRIIPFIRTIHFIWKLFRSINCDLFIKCWTLRIYRLIVPV